MVKRTTLIISFLFLSGCSNATTDWEITDPTFTIQESVEVNPTTTRNRICHNSVCGSFVEYNGTWEQYVASIFSDLNPIITPDEISGWNQTEIVESKILFKELKNKTLILIETSAAGEGNMSFIDIQQATKAIQ